MSQPKTIRRASHKRHFPVLLNEGLSYKLLGYAAAASAAGVGIMALAQPSAAEVVYTPAHLTVPRGGALALDLNNDGITDFTIQSFNSSCGRPPLQCRIQILYVSPNEQNGVWVTNNENALALTVGEKVGSGDTFATGYARMIHCNINTSSEYLSGQWFGVRNLYLGLSFSIAGQTHYGWARMSVSDGGECGAVARLTGYAYETVPGRPILTGKMAGMGEAGSEKLRGTTLGALALGSIGLAAWRRDEDRGSLD
jgi:hypothetical protein